MKGRTSLFVPRADNRTQLSHQNTDGVSATIARGIVKGRFPKGIPNVDVRTLVQPDSMRRQLRPAPLP